MSWHQSVVAAATCICEFLELWCGAWSHQSGTSCIMGRPSAIMWLERTLAWSHGSKSAWVKLWMIQTIKNTLRQFYLTCFSRTNDALDLYFMKEKCKSMANFLYRCNSDVRFLPTYLLVFILNSVFAFIHLQKISQPAVTSVSVLPGLSHLHTCLNPV